MKKIIYLLLLTMAVVSCRQENDFIADPNNTFQSNYTTYTGQFQTVWNAINTGYVFWDVTDVDWDQRYNEFKPRFEELDKQYDADSITPDINSFYKIYQELTDGLVDHHMVIKLKDVHTGKAFPIGLYPQAKEIRSRPYYHSTSDSIFLKEFISVILTSPNFKNAESGILKNGNQILSGYYELSDGRIIPYLWSSGFESVEKVVAQMDTETNDSIRDNMVNYLKALYDYQVLVTNTPREKIAGVIMDLRDNGGGNMGALLEYAGIFFTKSQRIGATRFKEGMGRYEMSGWTPFYFPYNSRINRDMAAENIPIVVLCDISSGSCSESTTYMIKSLPTGHAIGERTIGAHGPLLSSDYHDVTYCGIVGDEDLMTARHFIQTANYEIAYGGKCYEGVGITPDEEVLYNKVGYMGQFEAALKYIQNYK